MLLRTSSKVGYPLLQKAIATRSFGSTTATSAKVAVLGAAGGIGQPLSLLLKLSNQVEELACYDIVNTPGVAADISHVREENLFVVSFFILCV
jgi:malate dehydrogenase